MAETIALATTPPINTAAGFPGAADVDEQNSDDRAEHGNAAEHERINHRGLISAERERADQNRADQTDGIRFENVRGHAGAIADVIADVVRDGGRIARIVFLEALLDLADEIGADVGRFGVNAAAESREHADQTRAERETDETVHGFIVTDHFGGERVENSDGEEGETDDE